MIKEILEIIAGILASVVALIGAYKGHTIIQAKRKVKNKKQIKEFDKKLIDKIGDSKPKQKKE